MHGDGLAPGVQPEHSHAAGVQAELPEYRANGGRLAGPVGTEKAVDLLMAHLQVESVKRGDGAEAFHQARRLDSWAIADEPIRQ